MGFIEASTVSHALHARAHSCLSMLCEMQSQPPFGYDCFHYLFAETTGDTGDRRDHDHSDGQTRRKPLMWKSVGQCDDQGGKGQVGTVDG